MVAGLGTITPASGYVGPIGALVIGISAGIVCYYSTQYIKRTLKIDDSLDVFPVHGVGGILGTILAGVFVAEQFGGIGYAEGFTMSSQLIVQLYGVLATTFWCGIMTLVLLLLTKKLVGLRITEDQENVGLDVSEHDERGYII
jgi:Amt family ammonium transporter